MNARQMTLPPCGATRVGQHVRAFGVIAAVVFRAGLPFGVRLDEKAAEVGNEPVDLVGLGLPPVDDARVERIGGRQAAEPHRARRSSPTDTRARRRAARRSASAATLGRYSGERIMSVGVDAVDDRAVDADRGVRARVIGVARADFSGQLVPLPERAAGVAALDGAVEVVPVIHHPQLHLRPLGDVEPIDRLPVCSSRRKWIRAVERADVPLEATTTVGLIGRRRMVLIR